MDIDISHADIGSELCQRCAACCRIFLQISGTDTRYRKFLRGIGYSVYPPPKDGEADCCDQQHDITIDAGFCRHLEIIEQDGTTLHRCSIYGTRDFPELCADFDCVSWAKYARKYIDSNRTIVEAQTALNSLRVSKIAANCSR